MLLPEGTPDSLVEFMATARDTGELSPGHSEHRYVAMQEVAGSLHYTEGYLYYRRSGEVRFRANRASLSCQLPLYAWDKVVAFIPLNKTTKKFWLHPNMRAMLNTSAFTQHHYKVRYKARIEEWLKN